MKKTILTLEQDKNHEINTNLVKKVSIFFYEKCFYPEINKQKVISSLFYNFIIVIHYYLLINNNIRIFYYYICIF